MTTNVDIPEHLYLALLTRAEQEGCTVEEMVERVIVDALEEEDVS